MSASIAEFLDQNLPLPEVAACAVRLPDRTYRSRCDEQWFTQSQAEQILGRLTLAADSLGYHGIQPVRLCWIFERARIYLGLRRDGACLAVFVPNRTGPMPEAVGELLERFAQLPSG